jgi:hypothetical protein
VALSDRYVETPLVASVGAVEVIRNPARDWLAGRFAVAEDALRRFDPDWASLQMVCYGYEPRGLLLRSAARFDALRRCVRNSHLMFHELWIGEALQYGHKDRAIGWLQKQLLLRTARRWGPAVTHTSNPTYRALLQRNGVAAEELPLPGNIPIAVVPAGATARDWLATKIGSPPAEANGYLIVGVFGSIHRHWAEFSWLARLAGACEASGRRLMVLQIGRQSEAGKEIWAELCEQFRRQVRCVALGSMPAEEVSLVLQGIDLGLTTSPWALVGKSGAVAAMLEHGLPVAVPRADYRLRHGVTPEPVAHPLLHRLDDALLDRVRTATLRRGEAKVAAEIYDRFAAALAPSAA